MIPEREQMPRKPDPAVEARILEAAKKLWLKGGDQALSMRAIAQSAGTNTPTIYRRFRNRREILRTIVHSSQAELNTVLRACGSLEEAGQRIFEFVMSHPRDYELIMSGLLRKLGEPLPNVEFLKRRCAEWFGGSPEDYLGLLMAVWSLVHGAAMLYITKTAPRDAERKLSSVLASALRILVQNRAALSPKPS
jgi:AcrR family transcriptional regulator